MVTTSLSISTTCPLDLGVEVLNEGELLGLLSAIELIRRGVRWLEDEVEYNM